MRAKLQRLKDQLLGRLNIHSSYQAVFGTPDGNKVLRHIMKNGYITRPTFVAGDPHQSAMNEGSRRLALSIMRFALKDHNQLEREIERALQEEENASS